MKNFHVTNAIVLLSLFTCWEQGICTTSKMIISNNQKMESIYVSCSGNKAYEVSRFVPYSEEIKISLPPHGTKIWPPVTCIGRVSKFAFKEHLLYKSTSNDRSKKCEKTCYVTVANNQSFYHWDSENKKWEIIPATIWYP